MICWLCQKELLITKDTYYCRRCDLMFFIQTRMWRLYKFIQSDQYDEYTEEDFKRYCQLKSFL
jgi:hypothetical protein